MQGEDIETGPAGKPRGPPNYPISEERDTQWISWLIPVFIVANISMFVIVMYVNNCPKQLRRQGFGGNSDDKCVARFLGRFSFQPLSENPLFGPSAST